ncbi:hypothetical protein Y5S_00285 [Alcanivorax nanhaiticus]|uniref:Uncharacterized protein n=2 Tax=Alcanivorax nanhaiticus TaxID=1177154 RepID=A0A095TWA2_9GAMM|nr:hypothetical protein Y5S_00285 [Alcanivorax nanhaiticus]
MLMVMKTISADKLKKRQAEEIEITSACLSVCTVRVRLDGEWFWVTDRNGKIQRFNGPEHANNLLSHVSTPKATLLHHSAHAEMVGQPEGEVIPPLKVDFHWRSDHA